MLYDLLPDALLPSTNLTSSQPAETPPIDGIIGHVAQSSSNASSASTKHKYVPATTPSPPSNTSKNPSKTSKVNVVQSTTADKASKGKKKGKVKAKYDTPKQDYLKPSANDTSKCKPKFPCLICDEDHYTKDCSCCAKVIHLLKGTQRH